MTFPSSLLPAFLIPAVISSQSTRGHQLAWFLSSTGPDSLHCPCSLAFSDHPESTWIEERPERSLINSARLRPLHFAWSLASSVLAFSRNAAVSCWMGLVPDAPQWSIEQHCQSQVSSPTAWPIYSYISYIYCGNWNNLWRASLHLHTITRVRVSKFECNPKKDIFRIQLWWWVNNWGVAILVFVSINVFIW